MANLLLVRPFVRPDPDNTVVFAARAVATFNAIAALWGGLDAWRSDTVRAAPRLDVRRVAPPDDSPWEWFATTQQPTFNPATYVPVRDWTTDTLFGPKRRLRAAPLDDTASFWWAASGPLFVPVRDWFQAARTTGRPTRLRSIAPDDAWLFETLREQWYAAIDAWRATRTAAQARLDPRSQWRPDDSPWEWFASQPVPFSAANFVPIRDWAQVLRVRAHAPDTLDRSVAWFFVPTVTPPPTPTRGAIWLRRRRRQMRGE